MTRAMLHKTFVFNDVRQSLLHNKLLKSFLFYWFSARLSLFLSFVIENKFF